MNKKFLKLVILSFIVSLFLIQNLFRQKSVCVVKFASWGSESEISIMKPLISEFEKKNPDVKVDFMHIPQNYFQKIHLLFASNTAPDVIFINNQYLPVYVNAGVLEKLDGYDFELDKFYKKSLLALSVNKSLYAIPRDVSNLVIFYNKDIFYKTGTKLPNDNWTLDEFLQVAIKLSHPPEIFGISFEEEPLFYLPYIMAYGGWTRVDVDNFFNNDVLNNPKIKQGLAFYSDLRNKYHVAPYKHEVGSATMAQLFLQGKLAMHLSGRWLVPKYRSEATFDWDVVEFPHSSNGIKSFSPLDASGWSLSRYSKNKEQSIRLIKFLSSTYAIKKMCESGLIVPARVDVATSSAFLDNAKPKNAKAFLSVIEHSVPTPVSVDYREILDNMKIKTERIFNK